MTLPPPGVARGTLIALIAAALACSSSDLPTSTKPLEPPALRRSTQALQRLTCLLGELGDDGALTYAVLQDSTLRRLRVRVAHPSGATKEQAAFVVSEGRGRRGDRIAICNSLSAEPGASLQKTAERLLESDDAGRELLAGGKRAPRRTGLARDEDLRRFARPKRQARDSVPLSASATRAMNVSLPGMQIWGTMDTWWGAVNLYANWNVDMTWLNRPSSLDPINWQACADSQQAVQDYWAWAGPADVELAAVAESLIAHATGAVCPQDFMAGDFLCLEFPIVNSNPLFFVQGDDRSLPLLSDAALTMSRATIGLRPSDLALRVHQEPTCIFVFRVMNGCNLPSLDPFPPIVSASRVGGSSDTVKVSFNFVSGACLLNRQDCPAIKGEVQFARSVTPGHWYMLGGRSYMTKYPSALFQYRAHGAWHRLWEQIEENFLDLRKPARRLVPAPPIPNRPCSPQ